MYWNKRTFLHRKKSSTRTGLVWDTNMAAVLLFRDTNMAAVTTCENAPPGLGDKGHKQSKGFRKYAIHTKRSRRGSFTGFFHPWVLAYLFFSRIFCTLVHPVL